MGDAPRLLFGNCFNPIDHQEYQSLMSLSTAAVGVLALAHDLFHFDITSQVPERLSGHVASSMEAQVTWYVKLLQAWKEANPPPKSPEETSKLVIQTLELADDIEGLLKFYGLPLPHDNRVEVPGVVAFPLTTSLPKGVMFVFQTLREDARGVTAGDCLSVFVDVADPREAPNVPKVVQVAVSQRLRACANMDYATADACYKKIVDAGYRLLRGTNNEAILAKRYRLQLRGIDAPKRKIHCGKKAKDELTQLVQGKSLTVHVYGVDQFGQLVGDVYCNGQFVQEVMLKKGCAWHRAANDQRRPELIKWEMEARAARIGLWALPNPEIPWDWRKNNPEMPWEWRIPIVGNNTQKSNPKQLSRGLGRSL
ncbi:hypothetical protein MKW98_020788 [Papaver atlanticum]|uniref:TNase-like domain-containing protein n=1 Tax=Papaver atlanticum TaxID=357466 RepID=A0AAD4XUZ1_9MAGN|nr:hypothetical protein MKW98_020788 [Papaver atlanticum]